MIRKEVTVRNPEGLQAQAAALLVQTACRFGARIMLTQGTKTINAKSMMGVLSLGVGYGQTLALCLDGEDESEACTAVSNFFENGFK